jgi:hypothetical protein
MNDQNKENIKQLQELVDLQKENMSSEMYLNLCTFLKELFHKNEKPIYELTITYIDFMGSEYEFKTNKFLSHLNDCNCLNCSDDQDEDSDYDPEDCIYRDIYRGTNISKYYSVDVLDIIDIDLSRFTNQYMGFLGPIETRGYRIKSKNILISTRILQ